MGEDGVVRDLKELKKNEQIKKGFVYLLCQGCLVSQANEKQLDSCQLSMTIRL